MSSDSGTHAVTGCIPCRNTARVFHNRSAVAHTQTRCAGTQALDKCEQMAGEAVVGVNAKTGGACLRCVFVSVCV